MILAIETSCDDTCAAVVESDGRRALSNVVHTQTEHARYGGVVPEVASRAHLERMDGVIEKALADAGIGLDDVTGVAVTRDEAVQLAMAHRPGLVLADIQLADDSSGIDAVKDILAEFSVPVIFITAFPERLLTGERPEPTFLITKPFQRSTVKAQIAQALFFDDATVPSL